MRKLVIFLRNLAFTPFLFSVKFNPELNCLILIEAVQKKLKVMVLILLSVVSKFIPAVLVESVAKNSSSCVTIPIHCVD
jgi:hypothetical protein